MEKKMKAVLLKKRIAMENIKSVERFKSDFSEESVIQIPEMMERLDQHRDDYFAAMAKVEELDDSHDTIEACISERIDIEERYCRLKSFLRENKRKEAIPTSFDVSGIANSTSLAYGRPSAPNVRLPKIELPSFDGDATKWLSFRDRFVAMIDGSQELAAIAKLQYLLSSLKGDAAVPFEHVALTAENYASTWQALLKRYDNARLLIREYYHRLHHLPAVRSEGPEQLMQLLDGFTRHINGLVKLGEPVEQWDTPLTSLLLMKLDEASVLAYEKHSVHFARDRFEVLKQFIEDRIQILTASARFAEEKDRKGSSTAKSATVAGAHRQSSSRHTVSYGATATASGRSQAVQQSKCPLGCSTSHALRDCPEFIGKDPQQRRELVQKKGVCWNCLSSGHHVRACQSAYTCRICRERHHTMLHVVPDPSRVSMSVLSGDERVLLETVVVDVVDDYGGIHEARALLDSGSMANFISASLARRLSTPRYKVDISIAGIGQTSHRVKGAIETTIRSRSQPHSSQLEFLVLDAPAANVPTTPIDVSRWRLPKVPLADPAFNVPGRIDLIIGGDTYWELHTGRKRFLGKDKPWLVETLFGWVVAGGSACGTGKSTVCHLSTSSPTLESVMERFWCRETVTEDAGLSVEEELCESIYVATTTRNSAGRYVVKFPQTTDSSIVLGTSKQIADRRLLALERRLKSNPVMAEAYSQFMDEYEELGHMKRMTEPIDNAAPHYYLPHHAVVKETSTTTKVRVVFDASCKTTSGFSLNDVLLVGPVIQQDLYAIMLRFRSRPIALVADVEKMYRQVLHEASDRRFLRIRYRRDQSEPISTYELQTVTYGTASAPFLATRTLKQIALDHKEQYPRAAVPVMNDFYVDDLLTGAESVADAVAVRNDISLMLQSGGFTLKKWASNVPEALIGVPQEDLAIQSAVEWRDTDTVSTLGLIWEPAGDHLRFRIEVPTVAAVLTKRLVLSYIARVFDVLGLLGPTILVAKLFMQKLWTSKIDGKVLDWDTALPSPLDAEWRRFHEALPTLRYLKVPRFVSLPQSADVQLHAFADASHNAYGACVFIRAEATHMVSVQLLTAKSKVVSLSNSHSIARLELCGARLATQLVQKIQRSFADSVPVQFWTDSMTVLHWLNSPPRRWKPFVCNRVAQIQKATNPSSWNHVPGVDNPADDISRGVLPDKLLECRRWWHGPEWLAQPEVCWPAKAIVTQEDIGQDEERADPELVAAASTVPSFTTQLFSRFSNYCKLQRATAYWLRYIHRVQDAVAGLASSSHGVWTPLSRDELLQAELKLCRLAQLDSFQEEIQTAKSGQEMPRNSRLKWLAPFLDEERTLRVGGRLGNARGTRTTIYPIVLSSRHPLVVLLTDAYHRRLLHAGPQLLLAALRQRFWIIGGRNLCKQCFHKCLQCFRTKPVLIQQSVADLPASRVSPTRPFMVSGVDYCGPVMLKSAYRNKAATKAYIAVFVCFSTRAVHLELVSDLSTAAFLSALRRFIARRGLVAELHSDNATNFKGAAHELHRVYNMLKCDSRERDEIFSWCAKNEIRWSFIPPRAPHFGGLWEAAVRSVKQHLTRTLGATSVSQEGMLTLLAQIEQCLNSRPLVPLSSDPADCEPLTPGHFLVGSAMCALPQIDVRQGPVNRVREYEAVQRHMQNVWARWYPEYLQQLKARARHSNGQSVRLEEGQLVVIKDYSVPHTVWPLFLSPNFCGRKN